MGGCGRRDDVPYEDWIANVDRAGDAPEPFFSGRDGDLTAAAAAMAMVSRGPGRGPDPVLQRCAGGRQDILDAAARRVDGAD